MTHHQLFLSTLSLRRATGNIINCNSNFTHFYPRSPCGERHINKTRSEQINGFLSTLSLRRATEGDNQHQANLRHFYPRSPCGERRNISKTSQYSMYFYPRSPCGERRPPSISSMILTHFYPRSPCGERQRRNKIRQRRLKFLSTLSLRRATDDFEPSTTRRLTFLSTLSLRRATATNGFADTPPQISIHALLAESDGKG